MKSEIWKDIVGFEGLYEVSNYGSVRSIPCNGKGIGKGKSRKGGVLSIRLTKAGYAQIHLCKDGKTYYKYVHRLVYEAFNGPIPEGMQVNHINEDKTDNRPENLNLMSAKSNSNWGTRTHRLSKKLEKRVRQYDGDELVGIYDSATIAANFLGLNRDDIKHTCLGYQKTCGGYRWTY